MECLICMPLIEDVRLAPPYMEEHSTRIGIDEGRVTLPNTSTAIWPTPQRQSGQQLSAPIWKFTESGAFTSVSSLNKKKKNLKFIIV